MPHVQRCTVAANSGRIFNTIISYPCNVKIYGYFLKVYGTYKCVSRIVVWQSLLGPSRREWEGNLCERTQPWGMLRGHSVYFRGSVTRCWANQNYTLNICLAVCLPWGLGCLPLWWQQHTMMLTSKHMNIFQNTVTNCTLILLIPILIS